MTAAETPESPNASGGFAALGLAPALLEALAAVGYENPTAIQVAAIPHLLAGRDLLGQAQTGTGKTAAFALPMLQRLDLDRIEVQGLVLTPTRELALQVTEAIKTYAQRLGPVRIMTVYGGAPIGAQLTRIERGVHIVVGTPGRVMDCIRRGALQLDAVRMVALDEADEMLRMGFIDDVEWIVGHTPDKRQTALFSATMPGPIRRVAEHYLKNPITAAVQEATRTVADVEQRVLCVYPRDKLDALTRMLEVEPSEAVLVFARTQAECADLADALEYRGFASAPLHGGMSQSQREDVVRRLRSGRLRLVVATDVAARGLDVEHVSHVINMGPPPDPETYVHRIGRTGRAGRTGVAVLFLTPRERHIRGQIERFTRQRMVEVGIPTNDELAEGRALRLQAAVRFRLEETDLADYRAAMEQLVEALDVDPLDVAAALAHLVTREQPLVVDGPEPRAVGHRPEVTHRSARPAAPAVVRKSTRPARAPVVEDAASEPPAAAEVPPPKKRKPRAAAEAAAAPRSTKRAHLARPARAPRRGPPAAADAARREPPRPSCRPSRRRLGLSSPQGSAGPGPGDIVGALTKSGCPRRHRAIDIRSNRAVGGRDSPTGAAADADAPAPPASPPRPRGRRSPKSRHHRPRSAPRAGQPRRQGQSQAAATLNCAVARAASRRARCRSTTRQSAHAALGAAISCQLDLLERARRSI
ncbi:MAG: DEAD/DEAH box helicase [Deltaproteobacteria bacterium]|nr:DEAD/DEAH box helicase [Deltaproteobacteria bacterium]